MITIESERNKLISFDAKMPISQWPITNSLSSQKELYWYNKLSWNPEKTLEENKKQVVKQFMKTCCDFSFKRTKLELRGITVGKIASGEDIIFSEKGTLLRAMPESAEVLIFNEKEKFKGLRTSMTTNIFINLNPISLTHSMKSNFEKILNVLSEDPVGCEMMRVAISKYKGSIEKLPKLTFVPVTNQKIGLSYTTNCNAWKYVRKNSEISAGIYKKFCKDSKFIMFSPEWFTTNQTGVFLKINDSSQTEDVLIKQGIVPKEGILLHQMIYAFNVGEENEYRETQLISERTYPQYFHGNFKNIGDCVIPSTQVNCSIFADDKVYRAMYGLSPQGLDLINESSYFAHRYKFIRPTYIGINTKLNINNTNLNKKESYEFVKTFLKTNGDYDLFRYYLSPKSPLKYPEFGKGKYICSDLN